MIDRAPQQYPLEVALDDYATFENFYVSDANAAVCQYFRGINTGDVLQYSYVWGASGSGRTHLLQAICHKAQSIGQSAFYIPLNMAAELSPAILEGLDTFDLVCLDDIDCVLGSDDWESALFSLFNALRDADVRFIVSSSIGPMALEVNLKDLQSRLQSAVVFQLQTPQDADKLCALQLRAHKRGFELADDVARYVLQRNERSMSGLFDFLERLDQHSLITKRKITIPLVRELMASA
ncbi:MAG: DnaA regulatory inactivator Hda [Pseudohongiellaceae bacterium]|nr:DnaA regulatory inactivator Hda [Pseudohongiellaceae bacterium]